MRTDTRSRILDAAIALFDADGVRSAMVDAIAARAGVTKKTLYYHFRSKDDLMAAALVDPPATPLRAFDRILTDDDTVDELVDGLFRELAAWTADARWKGCAFARAAVELAGLPGHPAVRAARDYKDRIEAAIRDGLARQGAAQADVAARRIVILLDGAILHGMVHHAPDYAREAGRMAAELIRDALDEPTAHAACDVNLAPFATCCHLDAEAFESLSRMR